MRYFSYDEPAEDGSNRTIIMSEEEIRLQYYPTWYNRMCNKFGKDHVDSIYCFEDCLDDWIVIHYAREST
jgi:hypothetical protein